ncbi:PQQ-binding-like beta-propeller repeat protein [Alphaproteobacteria bacterium]|nr:PQQ-binding-like beta-propeller repeat protein [Alphaproteobacteria bacterium]MDC3311794.1 PQQ-binding-like beta-propeller repeat protein [Alphaproteobacteria bacterium]
MRSYLTIIKFLIISVLLASCANDGPILPGQRQSVLPDFSDVTIDQDAANEIAIEDVGTINSFATHAGGNAQHSGGNLELSLPLELSWSARTKAASNQTVDLPQPIIADNRLFSIGGNSVLHAFDFTSGDELWTVSLDANTDNPFPGINGGIAYENGTVIAHAGKRNLYAIDAETGAIIWQKKLEVSLRGGPTLNEVNDLVVTDLDGQVYVFRLSDGVLKWRRSGFPVDTIVYGTPSPAIMGKNIIVSGQAGEIAVYELPSGDLVWADSLASFNPRTPLERLGDIRAFPATDAENAYFISQSGRMSAFEVDTGFELWAKPLSGIEMPWVAGQSIFVVTIDGRLIAIRKTDGAVRWVTELPGAIPEGIPATQNLPRYVGPLVANSEVLLVRDTGELFRFDANNGMLINKSNLTSQITTPMQVAHQQLVTLSRDGTIRVFK